MWLSSIHHFTSSPRSEFNLKGASPTTLDASSCAPWLLQSPLNHGSDQFHQLSAGGNAQGGSGASGSLRHDECMTTDACDNETRRSICLTALASNIDGPPAARLGPVVSTPSRSSMMYLIIPSHAA